MQVLIRFSSPAQLGSAPLWPNTVLERHVKPADRRAGATKQIGWHTFRRSVATLLQSATGNVKAAQELLGHTSPVITLGTYAQAVTSDKRVEQEALAALFHASALNGPEWPRAEVLGLGVQL